MRLPAVNWNESTVEDAALSWFSQLGYGGAHAPHLAPGEIATERDSFSDVVLAGRLRDAIAHLNPAIPGLPLGVIELRIPEGTDKWFAAAYNQIQTYKPEIPSLMHYNEVTRDFVA